MNLFVFFLISMFVLGIPLAKKDLKWSYFLAGVATLGLAFAYYYLNQI